MGDAYRGPGRSARAPGKRPSRRGMHIEAPSGPTDLALGPAIMGREPAGSGTFVKRQTRAVIKKTLAGISRSVPPSRLESRSDRVRLSNDRPGTVIKT
ncbi:hypothetical protein PoB_000014200 [Plakobranchus ocellatus]|uniref:Uncharacterized protein n=1 Tax=Plakobranchus ocellatus TaxID=259542 RepID=A0AAV3XS93_9GAST|nr:hypothetical protein PoB_000014200 [Plakobranchus ocellatus]